MAKLKHTQLHLIWQHLKAGRTLTPAEAAHGFSCYRLAARIHDLRKEGHDIRTTVKTDAVGGKYAEYRLVGCN
jgi:hypothetical protein